MIKNKIIVLLLLILLSVHKTNVFASLRINEIYPAPGSDEYEWVEIYNDENTLIDISQYKLNDSSNHLLFINSSSIQPLGFIIATSSSVLNNTGDTVSLTNNLNELIDTVTYTSNFDIEKTFARCPDGHENWLTLTIPTKNSPNETACLSLTPTTTATPTLDLTPSPTIINLTPTSTPQPTPSPTNTPISYNNIYLSEIMVYPDTGDNEWIEIYNANDYPASLINWYIDDLENMGATPRIFSIEIAAKNYAVFNLSSSIFNNDGDNVRLLDFNKILKDSFEYNKSTKGKSLARVSFDTDSFCEQEPSKSLPNSGCIVEPTPTVNPTSTPKPTNTPTPTKTPTPIKINDKNGSSKQQTYSSYSVLSNNETYDDEEQINQENEPNELINNGDSMILGSAVKNSSYQSTPLLKSLSFISFSFSGLTIASLLFKIIKNMY